MRGGSVEKTPNEVKRRICELYLKGHSYGATARLVGFSQNVVVRALREAGIPARTKAEGIRAYVEREGHTGHRLRDA